MKKVTLKDIAQRLGVTVGTVSHVLNGIDDISPDTREKVLKTAKEMGYIQNLSAVSLRSGKSNTIAIIVPDVSNPHIAHQVRLMEDELYKRRYTALILNTDEDEEREYNAIVTASSRNVDGILLCPCQHSRDNIKFLQKIEIPYVLIGRYYSEGDSDYVTANDFEAGRLAGEYLLEKGYKNPIYIGAYEYIEASVLRFNGVVSALSKAGVNLSRERFFELDPKGDETKRVYEKILNDGISYDSVVAFSDFIAFELMSLLGESVPVIGFDAVNSFMHIPFSHASVGMKGNGWADTAIDFIFRKISGESERLTNLIDVEVFEF